MFHYFEQVSKLVRPFVVGINPDGESVLTEKDTKLCEILCTILFYIPMLRIQMQLLILINKCFISNKESQSFALSLCTAG